MGCYSSVTKYILKFDLLKESSCSASIDWKNSMPDTCPKASKLIYTEGKKSVSKKKVRNTGVKGSFISKPVFTMKYTSKTDWPRNLRPILAKKF